MKDLPTYNVVQQCCCLHTEVKQNYASKGRFYGVLDVNESLSKNYTYTVFANFVQGILVTEKDIQKNRQWNSYDNEM